jgi:ABC-type nitrate/sulfonate/bicarbonate transport system permease component
MDDPSTSPAKMSKAQGVDARQEDTNLLGVVLQRAQPIVRYVRTMTVVLILWQLASLRIHNVVLLPSPLSVGQNWLELLLSGELAAQAASSAGREITGFLLALCVAVPLAFLLGLSPIANDFIDPVIEIARPINAFAWIPLGLFIFGIGQTLQVFIIFYASFFPILLNGVAGVRGVDPVLMRAAKTMGLAYHLIVLRVIFPSAVPSILTGARLGAVISLLALIAAEFVGAPSGLGFAISYYGSLFRTSEMVAFIATLAVLGYLMDAGLRLLQRRLTPWAAGLVVAN